MILYSCIIEGCENPVENRTTGLCATHGAMERKAERDAKKIKVVKPVKKVSEKRADELTKYPKLKKDFLEHKMVCEIKLNGCTVTATEIHHTAGRIGKNFLDIKTWKSACHSCHAQIHDVLSAEENRQQGFKI